MSGNSTTLSLSGRHDSNVRPLGPKPSILPTVLRPECFRKSECKDSASRTIFQIYLRKSEAQPILRLRKQAKVVQAERNSKSQRVNIAKKLIFFAIERRRGVKASVATKEALASPRSAACGS